MGLQGNEILLYLSGNDVPIKECNIIVHQPTIKEISLVGEQEFLSTVQLFAKLDKVLKPLREGNSELAEYQDFHLLMILLAQDKETKNNVESFFELIFPLYDIVITERNIMFLLKETQQNVGMITPFNFNAFQQTIKNLFFFNDSKEIEYKPVNDRAKKIAEKLKRGREKVEQIKANEKKVSSMFGTYVSVLSIGMNIDMNILLSYTPFQIHNLFSRYWLKFQADFYQKVSTTPLMDTSKMKEPKDWAGNIYG